jgi:DNA-binding IclR family transcriptional regulator
MDGRLVCMERRSQAGPAVVSRVGAILRGVAGHQADGVSTTQLAREVGLTRPTSHRLLVLLSEEGLVDRDDLTGAWRLGPELYLLGTVAASRYDITHHAEDIVRRLAQKTGESAFLSARRGDETVCLLRQDGSFPLRSHVLHEGIRFPLGVASAGLAILAHLPERELEEYVDTVDLVPEWGATHAPAALRERVAETRKAGYATNPGLIVEGSWGMGAAVFDPDGRPAWALSLTGVESRFGPARRLELGQLLLDHAHVLTQRLRSERHRKR